MTFEIGHLCILSSMSIIWMTLRSKYEMLNYLHSNNYIHTWIKSVTLEYQKDLALGKTFLKKWYSKLLYLSYVKVFLVKICIHVLELSILDQTHREINSVNTIFLLCKKYLSFLFDQVTGL